MDKITYLNPKKLTRNPLNDLVYGKELVDDIKPSIEEYGILRPLIINKENLVIEGNRRLQAALELNLDVVPVILMSFDGKVSENDWFFESNKYRIKSHEQVIREYKAKRLDEEQKAKIRQLASQNNKKAKTYSGSASGTGGDCRDLAAKLLNLSISGKTADKHLAVLEKIRSFPEDTQLRKQRKLHLLEMFNEKRVDDALEWYEEYLKNEPITDEEIKLKLKEEEQNKKQEEAAYLRACKKKNPHLTPKLFNLLYAMNITSDMLGCDILPYEYQDKLTALLTKAKTIEEKTHYISSIMVEFKAKQEDDSPITFTYDGALSVAVRRLAKKSNIGIDEIITTALKKYLGIET